MSKKNIFVVGSGRSGTTWVQDLIVQSLGANSVFEPLHPKAFPEMGNYSDTYVGRHHQDVKLYDFFQKVVEGELANSWTMTKIFEDALRFQIGRLSSFSSVKQYCSLLVTYNKRLKSNKRYSDISVSKFIRANLMVDWMSENFDAPIFYIVRHPCAVIESRARLKNKSWGINDPYIKQSLSYYSECPEIKKMYDVDIKSLVDNIKDEVDAHAIIWCIQNSHLLNGYKNSKVSKFYYENLLVDGSMSLFSKLEELDFIVDTEVDVTKPSDMSSKDSSKNTDALVLTRKWIDRLSDQELYRIEKYLEIFKIYDYSVNNPLPGVR